MKIAITAEGPHLDASMDARFGRCAYFIIVETETEEAEAYPNPALNASGGAGTQAAQFIAAEGAQAAISGAFGPNAYAALEAAGITMYRGAGGTVRQQVEQFKAGALPQVTTPGRGHPRH